MIQVLTADETEKLLTFLEMDEAMNLPIIGDLQRHGFSKDFQNFWVQVDEAGQWLVVIRRFFEHYTVFAPKRNLMTQQEMDDAEDETEELGWFLRLSAPVTVSGPAFIVEALRPFLDGLKPTLVQQMSLAGDHALQPAYVPSVADEPCPFKITRVTDARDADVPMIGCLIFATEAFRIHYHSAGEITEGIRVRLQKGGIRHLVLKVNDELVCHAATSAETDRYALLTGIVTAVGQQRKGYAACLVSSLCRSLLKEGKIPCLFCKSTAAARMYEKLGFMVCGEYVTLHRNPALIAQF